MPKTQRRRRAEARTDYKARFALLKSEKPRLVIRKTNRYIIIQIVETRLAQDSVVKTFSSRELLERGWPKEKIGSLKSLAASYLTGYMVAKQLKEKVNGAVLDIGMHRNVSSSRIYAALKGVIDGGLTIFHNPKVFPTIERLKENKKTSGLIEKIKEKL